LEKCFVNEMRTTGLFVAAAAVSVGLAWAFRPVVVRSESEIAAEKRGSVIFPTLDPDTATSFQLTRYNEAMATLSRLELSKDAKSELWTLPSADGYPADSAEQVSQSITPLVELKVLSTVSTDRGDHALYGVVEPNEQELTVSASGVGILVNVGGADNKVLASLIIGKKVEGTENQHYVRVPSEDAVYEVEIGTDAFVTDLEKWIKGDILNVRSFDIEYVGLRDYAILRTERGYGLGRNFDADLENKDNKWSLLNFVDHTVEGSPSTNQPPDGKKLNETPLNDLRNNIQNLKIVNVRRKPAGLAADLKADKSLLENEESTANLQSQGFFPMESGDVYAAGGELLVGTKEGIRYLLRFGNTRVSSSAMEDQTESEEESSQGVNRYLLVTAQLDESKFPPPELKVVPETIEEMLAQEAEQAAKQQPGPEGVSTGGQAADGSADATQREGVANDSSAAPAQGAADAQGAAQDSAESGSPSSPLEEPQVEESSSEGLKTGDEASPGEQPEDSDTGAGETAPSDPNALTQSGQATAKDSARGVKPGAFKLVSAVGSAQEGTAEASAQQAGDQPKVESVESGGSVDSPAAQQVQTQADAAKPESNVAPDAEEGETQLAPSGKETQAELQERLEFLQETLRKENQRLIDSRNEKINEARKKVAELNARFSDWYYLVGDSVYNKLRVSRESLFQSADAPDSSAATPGGPQLPQLPPGFQLPTQ
jgi:hypothetical protein